MVPFRNITQKSDEERNFVESSLGVIVVDQFSSFIQLIGRLGELAEGSFGGGSQKHLERFFKKGTPVDFDAF